MIKFLFKGLMRDRSRSLLPVLVTAIGVMLTVFMFCYMNGAETDIIEGNAKFSTGHVKVMSRAYAEEEDQVPNDLAYIGVEELLRQLDQDYPQYLWTPRIRFGGLLDIPDERGETRSQGPVMGMAVDLLNESSFEADLLNLEEALIRGRIPHVPGEIIISDEFSERLGVDLGDVATLVGSTMYGSMTTANFTVVGTIRFGVPAMDRGAMIADISDIRTALDMQDAAGEVLGFAQDFVYRKEETAGNALRFNDLHSNPDDEFSPIMVSLYEQNSLGQLLEMYGSITGIALVIFILVMSIILWNAGLMGSLRRYGEIGLRLAIGEPKRHLYRTLIVESLMVGCVGSILGTAFGLAFSYYLQAKGINITSMMQNASMIMSGVIRARVTPAGYVIGFIPGLAASFLGTAISGIGIFRRRTAQLIKELET